jgi:F-type H+-transporting ATPase subunit b
VIYAIFLTAEAWASAAAGEHHEPSINEVWFPLINFLIFLFIIVRYALPLVASFLQSRRHEVVNTIEQASAKKEQAQVFAAEYRARLAGVEQESAGLIESLRQDGELLKTKLIEEAQALGARIREDARVLAEQEFKMARQKLLEDMAQRAEVQARELARSNLSADDHGRLVGTFIQNIGQTR